MSELPDGTDAHGETRGEDIVTGVMRQWRAVHPDLDVEPMGLVGRINRCAALLQQASDDQLRHEELTRAEFDLLGTLRRSGRSLTPGELVRETFASGAAVTKRLRRLEERGLVERRSDGRDRRVARLTLTEAGQKLTDRILPAQLAFERSLFSGLPATERAGLADGLADLLLLLEGRLARTLG
ncbi:MarR family winged helix-turn-helix transcriptional regulator [Streptacidiphilus sp. MAP5-3]|uniref:MarR family winged helix-turn-helix transcriptional regulator n=1 Tax=unclassified Streptacidiphilus TaxID=2643834 RepID=UPI0035139723